MSEEKQEIIYTKIGDKGRTSLFDATEIFKDDSRVEAYGTVDETNSAVGLLLTSGLPDAVRACLDRIQHELFDLGGELAMPGSSLVDESRIAFLEQQLDRYNAALPALDEFILPGGNQAAAQCHLARAICRRAERDLLRLSRGETLNSAGLRYLNRLSDLLFVVARVLARKETGQEVTWDQMLASNRSTQKSPTRTI